MFRMKSGLRLLFSLFISFLFVNLSLNPFYQNLNSEAALGQSKVAHKTEKYKESEIIAKFRPNVKIQVRGDRASQGVNLDEKDVSYTDLDEGSLPPSLKEINQKYKVNKVEKVFKGAQDPQSELTKIKQSFNREIKEGNLEINEERIGQIDFSRIYKISFDSQVSPELIAQELGRSYDLEYAEPNFIYDHQLAANDIYYLDQYPNNTGNRDPKWNPPYDYQWNLKKIQAAEGWDLTTGSEDIVVAIVDTGVDYSHPEFGSCSIGQVNAGNCSKIAPGYDFVNNDDDPIDDNGHGSHVAGIVSSGTNNSIGVAGLDWKGKIMPVKGLTAQGYGYSDWLANGIRFAAQNKASVINMSWGSLDRSNIIAEAIDYAFSFNVVLVAAAGNYNAEAEIFYPASDPNVITVAATDNNDQRAWFSNYGGVVEVAAPGTEIISLNSQNSQMPSEWSIGDKYLRLSGTSMSAPHVSGLAALVRAKNQSFSNLQVAQIIQSGADPITTDQYLGAGRINILKSLQIEAIPIAKITSPSLTSINGTVDILGTASGDNFTGYQLFYGFGRNPTSWRSISSSHIKVENGNLFSSWNVSKIRDGILTIRLVTYGVNKIRAENRSLVVVTNRIVKKMAPGWPIKTSDTPLPYTYSPNPSPVIANIDADVEKEIIIPMLNGKVYAYKYSGQLVSGWPVDLSWPILSSPGVADLDKDGRNEIVILSANNSWTTGGGAIYLFRGDGQLVPGWPIDITPNSNARIYNSPTLVDLDNDGDLEIVTGSEEPGVFAFHHTGEKVTGWPAGQYGTGRVIQANYATSAIADVDNDSKKEVIAATINRGNNPQVWALNDDATTVPGWPVYETPNKDIILWGSIYSSPAVGDLDNDGVKEIVFGNDGYYVCLQRNSNGDCIKTDQYTGGVFAFDINRNFKNGWPVGFRTGERFAFVWSSVALGNLDSDSELEVVAGTVDGKIYAFNHDGTLISGSWPVATDNFILASPVIFDVDNDRKNEILIPSADGMVYTLEANGTQILGWSLATESMLIASDSRRGIRSTPAVGDLDNDGLTEIVLVDNLGTVYLLKTNAKFRADWPMFNHDPLHTGNYEKTTMPDN